MPATNGSIVKEDQIVSKSVTGMTMTMRGKKRRIEEKRRRVYRAMHEKYCKNPGLIYSSLEWQVCDNLCRWEKIHEHQPTHFSLSLHGHQITYTPDILVEGIYLEPHGDLDNPRFIEKMESFKATYPEETVVLISGADEISKTPPGLFDGVLSTRDLTQLKPLINSLRRIRASYKMPNPSKSIPL